MKAEKSTVLTELEAILASSLYEFPATACKLTACPSAVQVSANVAKRIADRVSYEWGGQQIYFKVGAVNHGNSPMTQAVEEFLAELETFIRQELQNGSSLPDCRDCAYAHLSWDEVVTEMLSDVYAAFQKRQIYIPSDPDRRNMLIYREFTGNNSLKLARKYRLSQASIYHILGKCRKRIKLEGLPSPMLHEFPGKGLSLETPLAR